MPHNPYAVVLGEALIDLLDSHRDAEPIYRQAIGGAPLNVAVGIARLGGTVEFAGALSDDHLATRITDLLETAGVGTRSAIRVPAPTTLAVVTYRNAEPDFRPVGQVADRGLGRLDFGPDISSGSESKSPARSTTRSA